MTATSPHTWRGRLAALVALASAAALSVATGAEATTESAPATARAAGPTGTGGTATTQNVVKRAQSAPHLWWTRTFNSEFKTTSVDQRAWEVYDEEQWARDHATVLARNTTVGNGILRLQAKREAYDGRLFTTGDLKTRDAYALPNYFRVEVRAKVPFQQGMWSAPLWLRPADGSGGEIDLVETYGQERNLPRLHQTIHSAYGPTHEQEVWSTRFSDLPNYPGYATGWHTYVVEKIPGKITMWVDGKRTATFSSWNFPPYNTYYEAGKRWKMRVSLQVGGADGLPDATTNWSAGRTAVQVDYIRAYRLGL